MIILILALAVTASPHPKEPLQDDGFGVCPAFTHYHADWHTMTKEQLDPRDGGRTAIFFDGLCHRDDSDEPIKERPKLEKLKPKPDPKAKWL